MHWLSRKGHVFALLFLLYYVTFVVSPLTYNQQLRESDETYVLHDKSATPFFHLNVFFWELLCYGLDSSREIDNDSTTARVLIKRPRAVLRNNDISLKVFSSESFAYHEYCLPILAYSSLQTIIPADEKIPPGEVSPLYSGNSPPLS